MEIDGNKNAVSARFYNKDGQQIVEVKGKAHRGIHRGWYPWYIVGVAYGETVGCNRWCMASTRGT